MSDSSDSDKSNPRKKSSVSSKTSPNINQCSICLNEVNNPAFADGCIHKFCFQCLVEWSKRSNQCPICRTLFRNVIINVQSDTEFEQIPIETPSSSWTEMAAFNIIRDIIVTQHGRNATIRTRITQSDPNGNVQITNGEEIIPLNLSEPGSRPIVAAEAEFAQAVERLFNQFMAFNDSQIGGALARPNFAALPTPPGSPNPIRVRHIRGVRRTQLYPRRRMRRPNRTNNNDLNEDNREERKKNPE